MDVKKIRKTLAAQIEELERAVYIFENIIRPRYENDKVILQNMKQQYVKVEALMQKLAENPEAITDEDVVNSIPPQLR